MAQGVVDRIEDEWVILEVDGCPERRRRAEFGPELREGDVVDLATGQVDVEATARARAEASQVPGTGGSFDL